MILQQPRNVRQLRQLILSLLFLGAILAASPAYAIALHQVDDFQDGTAQNWQGATGEVLSDVGPSGAGDHSLPISTTGFEGGMNSRLVVFNGGSNSPMTTQWTGDWTATGVRRILLDVLNPNEFDLNLWLGIAGPDGPGGAGSVDSYVTLSSVTVPADELWHTIGFRVLSVDFMSWGTVDDPIAALQDVYQFRILHSPLQDWRGATGEANMLIDNVRTVPEPSTSLIAWLAASFMGVLPRFANFGTLRVKR